MRETYMTVTSHAGHFSNQQMKGVFVLVIIRQLYKENSLLNIVQTNAQESLRFCHCYEPIQERSVPDRQCPIQCTIETFVLVSVQTST